MGPKRAKDKKVLAEAPIKSFIEMENELAAKPIPDQVFDLASISCTLNEISKYLQIPEWEIRNKYGMQMEKGWAIAQMRIRKVQYNLLQKENPTLAVHLGKAVVDQRDGSEKQETILKGEVEIKASALEELFKGALNQTRPGSNVQQ